MALMSGCNNNRSNTSVPGIENSLTENALSQHVDITDWELTAYETVNNLEVSDLETSVSDAIISHNDRGHHVGEFRTESHVTLKTVEDKNTAVVYLMAYYVAYDFPDGSPKKVSGSHIPVALTFSKDEKGGYTLTEYWEASDGSHYAPSIRNKFPLDISEQAIDTQLYIMQQQAACDEKVKKYMSSRLSEEELLLMIMSSPKEASNTNAYIAKHREEYNMLVSRGDTALRYIYARFLEGGQTGLEGWIMLSACREILGDEDMQFQTNTPQEWFDAFTEFALRTRNANSDEYMEKHNPRAYLLLQMLNETKE
jgi:hypothetical protein